MSAAMPCPICGGDDRFYRVAKPQNGGDPFWICNQCDHKEYDRQGAPSGTKYCGSSVTLAQAEAPAKPGKVAPTRFDDLARYAAGHGVDLAVFTSAGWSDVILYEYEYTDRDGKPGTSFTEKPEANHRNPKPYHALRFDTDAEPRYRLLDYPNPKQKYWHAWKAHTGINKVWYKLSEALALAMAAGLPLVLCNGEASTVAAQHWGIPAATVAGGGETGSIPDHLFASLRLQWSGPILVALDGDDKGRKAAPKLAAHLAAAGYAAEAKELGPGLDLADFARLHQDGAMSALISCQPVAVPPPPTSDSSVDTEDHINHTDLGNATRLALMHGDKIRFVHSWGSWLVWDQGRWVKDDTGAIIRLARSTVKAMYAEAAKLDDSTSRKNAARWAIASESAGKISAMIDLAKSEPGIAVRDSAFDTDPMLLSCFNGTLDLRTGQLRPHAPSDLITKRIDVAYRADATAPHWDAFIARITNGNAALAEYLQRAAGYSLTGDVSEQCLFFCYGEGSNGKTTFLETLATLMGGYSQRAAAEMLMQQRNGGGIPNDVARLQGARYVVASEVSEGRRLDESKVKDLTGGDTITARFMRAEFFDFKPIFKLWMFGNHKPVIRGADNGIWRRLRVLPFLATITEDEKDPHLIKKFGREMPGILAWVVRGCLAWQRDGLTAPPIVADATAEYRRDQDVIGAWIDECCVIQDGASEITEKLLENYREWCERSNEYAQRPNDLAKRFAALGLYRKRVSHNKRQVWQWNGIRFRVDSDPVSDNLDRSRSLDRSTPMTEQNKNPRERNPRSDLERSSDLDCTQPAAEVLIWNQDAVFDEPDPTRSKPDPVVLDRVDRVFPTGEEETEIDAPPESLPALPPGCRLVTCDHTGTPGRYGIWRKVVGPDGEETDLDQHTPAVVSAAWRRWGVQETAAD